jgi:hydrogenase/urease accessory protein HupE
MALFALVHILAIGIWLGIRKGSLRKRTFVGVLIWFTVVNAVLGIVLAVRGVERPDANFENKRSF